MIAHAKVVQTAQATHAYATVSFEEALDQCFDKSPRVPSPTPPDRATALSHLDNIELPGARQLTSTEVELQLKTITWGPADRPVVEADTLPAIKEGGQWKLDLVKLTQSADRLVARRASAHKQTAEETHGGISRIALLPRWYWRTL